MLANVKWALEEAGRLPERLQTLTDYVKGIDRRLDVIGSAVKVALEPKPPYACMLVRATSERIKPFVTTLDGPRKKRKSKPEMVVQYAGASMFLVERQGTLSVQTQVDLHDVSIIVFCDLSRVQVCGIFKGIDMLSFHVPAQSPIAWCKAVPVGTFIRANLERT